MDEFPKFACLNDPVFPKTEIEYFYRFENFTYANGLDVDGNPYPGPGRTAVRLVHYEVLRRTPKGVWLYTRHGDKFVNLSATKRFACPTIEEAKESFYARKARQVRICAARIESADRAVILLWTGSYEG